MIRTASSTCCRPGNQRRRSSFLICTLRVVAAVPAQISSHGIARMNLRKGPHQPAQADGALVGARRGQGARCRRSLGAGELVRSVAYAPGLGRTRPFTRESAHGERCRSARVVLPAGALGASRNIGAVVGRPQPRHNQHRHLRALGQPQWLCVCCHIPPTWTGSSHCLPTLLRRCRPRSAQALCHRSPRHIVRRRPVPSQAREHDDVGTACALLANTGVGLG